MDSQEDLFDLSDVSERLPSSQPSDVDTNVEEEDARFCEEIMQMVVTNQMFAERDVASLLTAACKTGREANSEVGRAVLARLIKLSSEWSDGDKELVRFLTKAAIDSYDNDDNPLLWNIIDSYVSQSCFCVSEGSRRGACGVMRQALTEVRVIREKEEEEEEEEDESQKTAKGNRWMPDCMVEKWAKLLTQRRIDKASAVRSEAVTALAELPSRTFDDFEKKPFEPNDYVLSSLSDIDAFVRLAAVKASLLLSTAIIDLFLERFKEEDKPDIRRFFAAKVISGIHLMSFTKEQRAFLVRLLFNHEDALLRRMASSRLVSQWMPQLDPTTSIVSLFHPEDVDAARVLTTAFIEKELFEAETELTFVEALKKGNHCLHIDNWSDLFRSNSAPDISPLLLYTECAVSVLHSRGMSVFDKCICRLLPTMREMCDTMEGLIACWLSVGEEEGEEENVVGRLMELIEKRDGGDTYGRKALETVVKKIVLSPEIRANRELTEKCMGILMRMATSNDDFEMLKDWAMYEMNPLLFPPDESVLEEASVRPPVFTVDNKIRWRCSLVLLCLLKDHPKETELGALTVTLFNRLVIDIFASEFELQRDVACEIITLVCCMSKDLMRQHVRLLKGALMHDVNDVKVKAVKGLCDVVCIYSVETVEEAMWGEEEEEGEGGEKMVKGHRLLRFIDGYANPTSSSPLSLASLHSILRIFSEYAPTWPTGMHKLLVYSTRDTKGLGRAIGEWMERECEGKTEWRILVVHAVKSLLDAQLVRPYHCSITSTIAKAVKLTRKREGEEDALAPWMLGCTLMQHIIDEPESSTNKQIVAGLHTLEVTERVDFYKEKMKGAIEQLAIYEQSAVGKMLIRVMEKMTSSKKRVKPEGEGPPAKKRGRPSKAKEESEAKREGDEPDVYDFSSENR